MVHTVVSLVDFSDCAGAALAQAARIARLHGATLHTLHVVEALVVRDLAAALHRPKQEVQASCQQDSEQMLQRVITQMVEGVEVVPHVSFGAPLAEVRGLCERVRADLLVLGAYGVGGAGRGVGTLASQCVRSASPNVLLVPEGRPASFGGVVACVDFSETSKRVLREAVSFSEHDGARLTVLHAFDPPWRHLHYMAPTPQANPDFKAQFRLHLESRVRAAAEEAGADPNVVIELSETPRYADGIIGFTKAHDIGLVVIGTKGRTNLRYVLLGSTAERVIRAVPSAVLAIKPAS